MAQKSEAESQEWVVTGMDCASCATKIRTAVERLPGVSDVNVAVMAEKLTLKLEPGTTPRDKIEAAKRLLHQDSTSVTGIALDLGFVSSQYFATVFKRITGVTPSRYRHRREVPQPSQRGHDGQS